MGQEAPRSREGPGSGGGGSSWQGWQSGRGHGATREQKDALQLLPPPVSMGASEPPSARAPRPALRT